MAVGGVNQLRVGQAGVGPVGSRGLFRLDEALVEQHGHRTLDAHVLAVTLLAKHGVEFQHVGGLHAQLGADALAVVGQAKAGLGHTAQRQQLGHHGAAGRIVQLEHPGPVQRGELPEMRALGDFVLQEGRFGFGG